MLVAQRWFGVGKKRDAGDIELHGALGIAHALIDGETVHARHRGNRRAGVFAFDDEERPDQIVGCENILANEATRPFGLAVTPKPRRQIEGRGARNRPRAVPHLDRPPEFDRHFAATPERTGFHKSCTI